MSFMDVLRQYVDRSASTASPQAGDHFRQVAADAPPDLLAGGLAEAFRSEQTPAFGDMVAKLFGQSDPQQRAGLLNQLVAALGPQVLSRLGLGTPAASGAQAQVTSDEAAGVDPGKVAEVAEQAAQHEPAIIDRISGFYARHPQLVQALGTLALTVALRRMSQHGPAR